MIRIPQVRVVDEEGAQLGVMPTPEALAMAQERGYDLVEVAPMASPPVVKFLDFGQYKYELTKRDKENKRRQRSVTFKEVRLTPKIGSGDFETKVHRAIEFLEDGDRIKVTVRFRGRELTHPELGRNMLTRFTDESQGTRDAGAGPAARGQVDAHHDGIAPQAQGARGASNGIRRATTVAAASAGRAGRGGTGRRTGAAAPAPAAAERPAAAEQPAPAKPAPAAAKAAPAAATKRHRPRRTARQRTGGEPPATRPTSSDRAGAAGRTSDEPAPAATGE